MFGNIHHIYLPLLARFLAMCFSYPKSSASSATALRQVTHGDPIAGYQVLMHGETFKENVNITYNMTYPLSLSSPNQYIYGGLTIKFLIWYYPMHDTDTKW